MLIRRSDARYTAVARSADDVADRRLQTRSEVLPEEVGDVAKPEILDIRTTRSVDECEDIFCRVAEELMNAGSARVGRLVSRIAGNDDSGFFTPTESDLMGRDPDPPDLTIGVNLPKMAGAAQGATKTVQMYVWDRGEWRDVEFYGPMSRLWNSDTRSGTKAALGTFAEAIG